MINKKTNTLLFILGATIFNIFITLVILAALSFVYVRLLIPLLPSERVALWGFIAVFIISILVSFIIYRIILKHLLKRVNIEKYFTPIFNSPWAGKRKGPGKP